MINISYIAPKRYSIPSATLNAVGRGIRGAEPPVP
jgi:hypothetical protein